MIKQAQQVVPQQRWEVKETVRQGDGGTVYNRTEGGKGEAKVTVRYLKGGPTGSVTSASGGITRTRSEIKSDEGTFTRKKSVGDWELKDGKFVRRDIVSIDGIDRTHMKDRSSEAGSVTSGSVRRSVTEGEWELKDGKFIRRDKAVMEGGAGWENRDGTFVRKESSIERRRSVSTPADARSTSVTEGKWELKDGKWVMRRDVTITRDSVAAEGADYGGHHFEHRGAEWKETKAGSTPVNLPKASMEAEDSSDDDDSDASSKKDAKPVTKEVSEIRKPVEEVSRPRQTIRQQ